MGLGAGGARQPRLDGAAAGVERRSTATRPTAVPAVDGDAASTNDIDRRRRGRATDMASAGDWSQRLVPALLIGALPLALAAVPVFVLGRLLAG